VGAVMIIIARWNIFMSLSIFVIYKHGIFLINLTLGVPMSYKRV